MKPVFFNSPDELILFINSQPEVDGGSKFGGCSELKRKLLKLVPRMFELRDVLVKHDGGVGNYKSLRRYAEEASDNVSREAVEKLEQQMKAIDEETEKLLSIGASEDLAEQAKSARKAVSLFEYMRDSIMGFKNKQKVILERINKKAQALFENISENQAALKKILGADAAKIEADYADKIKKVEGLSAVLDEYSELNLAYLSILHSHHEGKKTRRQTHSDDEDE